METHRGHGSMSYKQDLTMYGEQELSLVVMNDSQLYNAFMRCDDTSDLKRLCEAFEYSAEQFEELESDLEEELKDREAADSFWS